MARHDLHRACGPCLKSCASALLAVAILALGAHSAWAQSPPSTRIGVAALITPAAADAYYGSSTASTNGLGLAQRPDEIRELARALRNDVDLIYDYVRNNIEIEWAYGLRKGALGALLDRSGTAFDQAKLMVDLLREAGYSASYQAGTITLSGAQFYDWSGVQSATAACQLLSGGAIPAIINGSTLSDCSYGAATVSTITLSHAWVSVVIGGTSYVFDPSYKPHTFISGFNLYTATGLTSGQALSNASSGMSSGTTSGVPYVRNLNAESLNSTLQTYGTNLLTYMNANAPAGSVEDLVGGQYILRYDAPAGGLRQTSLPYSATVQRTWTGGIPDQYRTTLSVEIRKLMTSGSTDLILDRLLFVDEIYGRKLIVEPNYVTSAGGGGSTTNIFRLRLTDGTGASVGPTYLDEFSVNEYYLLRDGTVTLIANLPYASAADGTSSTTGAYMDATISKSVYMLLPFTILNAWGDANAGLAEAWGQLNDAILLPTVPPACETCPNDYWQTAGDARREQLAVGWMTQASRAARLHAAIGHGVYTHHYSLGIVASDAQPRQSYYGDPSAPPASRTYYYNVHDTFDRIDVEDGFSYTSASANAADRRAAVFAIAATREALEASIAGQVADLPDTSSTATRFEWGNRPPAGEDPSNNYGPRRFYQFNSANASLANDLAVTEGRTTTTQADVHACAGEPPIGATETIARRGRLSAAITPYASAGFDIVASEEAFLGPGQRASAFYETGTPAVCSHYDSLQRGGAFVAVRSVNGEPVEIAHVVVGSRFNAKGGGGGAQTTHDAQYDPSTAADILRSRFVDRSSAVGVDLNSGAPTYASPAGLSVGNGEFPYSLSANLIWRGGFVPNSLAGPDTHTQPSAPWTSNWHNMLSISASGIEALGETDARAAAGAVASFLALQDVYRQTASTQRDVTAQLVSAWWLKQVSGNVATVAVGTSTRQFVRDVNGQWFSPGAGAYATLTQTGVRTVGVNDDPTCQVGATDYTPTRGWIFDTVSFQVTNANGDVQAFAPWRVAIVNSGGVGCAAEPRGFRMTTWTFPRGVTINLTYQWLDGTQTPVLTEVSNTLGRRIRFTYASTPLFHWAGFDNGLSGADLRAVAIAATTGLETITGVTDAAGAQTRFSVSTIAGEPRLTEVFDADDTTIPSLRYTYDTLGRVMEARDAVALQSGGRDPYEFRIAPGARGEREDPAGGRYTVMSNVYDTSGVRSQRHIDEINRSTSLRFDGRGRVTAYAYPELNEERLSYDARNRVTELRRCAKSGCNASTDIVIAATWNDTWNKPATITDARGFRTDFAYVASGVGGGEILTATRPAPSGGTPIGSGARPIYSFTYGAFGRVATSTDPTGLVVSNSYNATNGNLNSTTLDPGTSPHVNATTSFTYDALGDVATTTDARGNATSTSTDAMRRPTLVRHHNGGTGASLLAAERTNYNTLGQITSREGGTAFSGTNVSTWLTRETRTYTPTGQVATVKDGLNNTTTNAYDALDRVLSVTDPVGRVTRNSYDLAGQLLLVERAVGTAIEQDYARYTYSANGQRLSVRDANNNRSEYAYDGFDRLIELHFPSTTFGANQASATDYEGYGYDPNGNRTSMRLRSSETIGYTFDNLNRESVRDIPGGTASDVYTDYDLAGRRLSARFGSTSGQGIITAYDSAGRLTSETSTIGTSRALSFQYDAASNRTRITWPDSVYAQYAYDALNRVDQIAENGTFSGATLLADYDYDALSRRATLTRGNGAVSSFAYDNASRLTGLTQNLTGTSDDQTFGFSFTAASQISQRTASNDNYAWYGGSVSRSYSSNGLNQYTNVGAAAFNYDARGNLISDGSRNFAYDLENHLTQVSGSASLTLAYDPLGRLRQTTASSVATDFLYDGDRLSAEYNSGGTLLRRYVHGPGVDEPITWYEGSGTSDRRHLVTDHQGSVIATNGATTTRYPYGPYGEPDVWAGSRFRYTGQAALPEVALYHYKARVYDPVLGRFLQTDPVGYEDDPNLYAYVRNDPLNHTDPTGRTCTQNEDGKGMTCRVDDAGRLSPREVRLIERAYTRAVNRLLHNPNRNVRLTVNGRSFTTNAGVRAQALAGTFVRGSTARGPRAETIGGPLANRPTASGLPEITIYRNALQSGTMLPRNVERDLGMTFIHESFHLDPGEAAMMGNNLFDRFMFNFSDFGGAHQPEYRFGALQLYNNPELDE